MGKDKDKGKKSGAALDDAVKNKVAEENKNPKTAIPAASGAGTAKVPANITRGRMPVAVVAQVRFGDQKNESTTDLAKLFGTTTGKIDDIKKNANFAYVEKDFKPTQVQKDEGIAWLKRHSGYNEGAVDVLLNELEATDLASEAEAAAFASKRKKGKGQPSTDSKGDPIDGGGGNRVGKGDEPPVPDGKAGAGASGGGPTADDLLK